MKIYLLAIGQIFKITFTILLFIFLPLVVFTLVSSRISVYGIKSFVVLSGSMEPSVPLGSIVYTLKLPVYKIGDVIAFKKDGVTVTHRIAGVEKKGSETYFQTKGDANKTPDNELVSSSQVLGKKVYLLLNAGKLIVFLRTIPGFILILILPSLVFIGFEFWNIKREFEKEVRKKVLEQFGNGVNVTHPWGGID